MANRIESEYYGAHVTLVDGLISDCARMVGERKQIEGWFDVSTHQGTVSVGRQEDNGLTKSPTQLGWRMPQESSSSDRRRRRDDGMWKAFDEMSNWAGRPEAPKDGSCAVSGLRAYC